jgi:hypothetical protein
LLIALWIEDGERWGELPTVSRGRGGGPVSNGDRGRENWAGRKCARARVCVREAKGRARGPEKGVIMCKQELASRRRAWRSRRRSGKSSATWRTHGQASTGSGGRRHSRGVTRGTLEGRRWRGWCCDGERRRSTARGGSRVACRSGDKPARGQEAAGQRPGRHVHGCRGVREL